MLQTSGLFVLLEVNQFDGESLGPLESSFEADSLSSDSLFSLTLHHPWKLTLLTQ